MVCNSSMSTTLIVVRIKTKMIENRNIQYENTKRHNRCVKLCVKNWFLPVGRGIDFLQLSVWSYRHVYPLIYKHVTGLLPVKIKIIAPCGHLLTGLL